MEKKVYLLALVCIVALSSFAQQLPLNTCGIVNIYDNAGNRTKRIYFCNNGQDPYPTKAKPASETMEFQAVDALYPNPTTGTFFITFSKPLQNAVVSLLDVHGRILQHFTASGNKVDFNLSREAGGVYFVRIQDGNNVIHKRVVKQ
jgi:hypothetical protein